MEFKFNAFRVDEQSIKVAYPIDHSAT